MRRCTQNHWVCHRQWVDLSVFHHVSQETDAYSVCKKLEGIYERKKTRNKAFAIRKLVNLKLKSEGPLPSILMIYKTW